MNDDTRVAMVAGAAGELGRWNEFMVSQHDVSGREPTTG
ncbi:MAG: hypothetical protein JWP40_4059 [Blastococcus sp.]|jgi:hypothetical protein|nr:hypothetical protein [Blastococcus sp.]